MAAGSLREERREGGKEGQARLGGRPRHGGGEAERRGWRGGGWSQGWVTALLVGGWRAGGRVCFCNRECLVRVCTRGGGVRGGGGGALQWGAAPGCASVRLTHSQAGLIQPMVVHSIGPCRQQHLRWGWGAAGREGGAACSCGFDLPRLPQHASHTPFRRCRRPSSARCGTG